MQAQGFRINKLFDIKCGGLQVPRLFILKKNRYCKVNTFISPNLKMNKNIV